MTVNIILVIVGVIGMFGIGYLMTLVDGSSKAKQYIKGVTPYIGRSSSYLNGTTHVQYKSNPLRSLGDMTESVVSSTTTRSITSVECSLA